MLKNKILLTIFCITSLLSIAQTEISKKSYIIYHQKCRNAEKQFLRDSLEACFNTYNEVFEEYEILFPRDCFMAAQIAHKSQNDSLAVEFLLKGIQFGLNPNFFTDDSLMTRAFELFELKRSNYWVKISQQRDSLYNIYTASVDWNLKYELMAMVRVDQSWRKKNNKWFNRNFRKGLEKRFKVINDIHMNFLDSVFKEKGYPGSWLTGIGDSLRSQSKYASFLNLKLIELPHILLYHNDSIYFKSGRFLFNEIDKGHIHPRTYAMIRDFSERHLLKKDKEEKMFYNIWWERDNYSKIEIEQHCDEIGCPTKQHLRNLNKKLGLGYDIFWSPF